MTKQMIQLTRKQCALVSGGSGYINSSGRSGTETTTTSSGLLNGGGRSGYISSSG
jgi:hypothetical protein